MLASLGELALCEEWTGEEAQFQPPSAETLDMLARLKTVDGSGSGLDADKLDGKHASHFATAAQMAGLAANIQTRARFILPEDFGVEDDGAPHGEALQAWIDAGAGEKAICAVRPGRTYLTDRTLFARRDRTFVDLTGAVLRMVPGATQSLGGVLSVVNMEDGWLRGGEIDANHNFINCAGMHGLNDEFDECTVFNDPKVTRNFRIEGGIYRNAKFHVNNREQVDLSGVSGTFQSGEIVHSFDGTGRPVYGIVVAWNAPSLICDWHRNRIGHAKAVTGALSGATGTVAERISVMVNDPLGNPRPSWKGLYGGKGLTIQSATENCHVAGGWKTIDSDTGLSIESTAAGSAIGNSVSDGAIIRAARTPITIFNTRTGRSHNDAQVRLRDIVVEDPCLSGWYFGVMAGDRAANVEASNIVVRTTPDYEHPHEGLTLVTGLFTRSRLSFRAEAARIVTPFDLFPQARWGSGPGVFSEDCGDIELDMRLHAVEAGIGNMLRWWNGTGYRPVNSKFDIAFSGWDSGADLFGNTNSSIVLRLRNLDTGATFDGRLTTVNPSF